MIILHQRFVSVNDTKFTPGSMTAQSSSSDSNSSPLVFVNVNVGAEVLDISILRMKSLAPFPALGSTTTTGVDD